MKDIQVSHRGVVAVATDSGVRLFGGGPSPNFGRRHELACPPPSRLTAFCFTPQGNEVITGASDGFLRWWDVETGDDNCTTQFPVGGCDDGDEDESAAGPPPISSLACCKDSDLVAVAGGRIVCIFGQGGVYLHTIGPLSSAVVCMEWRTRSDLAVNIGSGVQMFSIEGDEVEVGPILAADDVDGGGLTVLATAPGGKMLAAGCSSGSVRIWNLEENEEHGGTVQVKGFQNTYDSAVGCLAWDESGSFLATAGGSEVIVWDMGDNNNEPKDGKDDYIVCYGNGQKAKITALAFQPRGNLLATGGDDCQVLVFDSANFSSNGENVVGGLVGCLSSGRVVPEGTGAVVTAVAWHPSSLVLAGTSSGKVDAFRILPGPDADANENSNQANMGGMFLIQKHELVNQVQAQGGPQSQRNRTPRQHYQGWGGEPLLAATADDGSSENQHPGGSGYWQSFVPRNRVGHGGNNGSGGRRGPRVPGSSRAKTIFHQMKNQQSPRPPFPEGTQQAWHTAMVHPGGLGMVRWPMYTPHMQYPQYVPQQVPQAPVMQPYAQQSSQPGFVKAAAMPGPAGPSIPRMPMPTPQGGQFPMAYALPYPQPYAMGYTPQYAYYPQMSQMGPQHMQEQMPPQPLPDMNDGNPQNPSQQMSSRQSKGLQRDESTSDLNEDAASKSSERTNNGVNSMGPVTPSESSTSYDDNGRMMHGVVTLYVGNLALNVDEHLLWSYFVPFGTITNIQVIRDRETKQSRGFAFITYTHPISAQTAINHMDGQQFGGQFEGRRLKVSFSNRRP